MAHRAPQALPKDSYSINRNIFHGYDVWLLTITLCLVGLGLIMVTSSSITVADRQYAEPLYFFWKQLTSVSIALVVAFTLLWIPMYVWERLSTVLLATAIILLVLVLIPGVGREVNGSMRWIDTSPFPIQASEPVKFCIIAYLAGYLVRHGAGVREQFVGFIKPIIVLTLVSALLLLEPDYGTCVVIFAAALGMLFIGGVPLNRFFAWMLVAGASLATLAVLSPYRIKRLISFLDPWQDPFNSGFQLTQALIAFGRGHWQGAGLGSSIQKLFYLPEAHTDFVFAILAEELGLWGSLLVILLFCFLVWRAFVIGQVAEVGGRVYSAFFAYGTGLVIGTQAFINIGVNMGILPTKGLTLPFVSYGGNSMIVSLALIAMLLRIEYENRQVRRVNIPPRSDIYAK